MMESIQSVLPVQIEEILRPDDIGLGEDARTLDAVVDMALSGEVDDIGGFVFLIYLLQ